jgi:peptidoglycan/LPS O-acetylase OafA/YrhL
LSEWRHRTGWFAVAVTFISLISYSLYLLHASFVQGIVMPWLSDGLELVCWSCAHNPWSRYVTYWAVSVVGAFLLSRYFERPTTALREKFQHRPKRAFAAELATDKPFEDKQRRSLVEHGDGVARAAKVSNPDH